MDGAQLGDTLALPAGGGTVEVEAVAESTFPVHMLELVQGGRVVAAVEEPQGARRLALRAKVHLKLLVWRSM